MGKKWKKADAVRKALKQKHVDALRPSQFLWANIRKKKEFTVSRTNLRSSLFRKKTFAPDGPKLWAGHQTL